MAVNSFQSLTLTESITLNWPTFAVNPPYVYDLNFITSSNNAYSITLPNATQGLVGFNCEFNNAGGVNTFTIFCNDGETPIVSDIAVGQNYRLILIDTSTANGTWRAQAYVGSDDPIVSVTAASPDSSLKVTNPTVTPPSGTIDFELQPSLGNLQAVATTGYVTITANDPSTWNTVAFTSDANINITNPDGVAGASNFSLNDTITVPQANIGTLNINGNVIMPAAASTNLMLSTADLGVVNLNGATFDSSGNLTAKNLTLTGAFLSPFASFVTFVDTGTSIIITQNVGFSRVEKIPETTGRYTVAFNAMREDRNYSVVITANSQSNIDQPPILLGFLVAGSETAAGFDIVVTDQNGELATAIPNGITILLLSATNA